MWNNGIFGVGHDKEKCALFKRHIPVKLATVTTVTFSAECPPSAIWQKPTLRWQKSVTYLEARTQMRRGLLRTAPWPERARSERKDGDQWVSLSLLQRRNIKVCDFSRSLTTSNFGLMRFFSSITSLSLDRHSWSSDLNTHIFISKSRMPKLL